METQRVEKRKKGWLITAVALMLFSAVLAAAVWFASMNNDLNKQAVERSYEQNLYDLSDNLDNLEVNLSKLMVAPSGKYAASLLTDVYNQALGAEKSLSLLPIDWHESESAASFLNKVADFAISYQRNLIEGGDGEKFTESVKSMYNTTRTLNDDIRERASLVAQNKLDIRKITSAKPYTFRTRKNISHNSVDYPELIYDGPFSDGRAADEYKYFDGTGSITLKEAKQVAIDALSDRKVKSVTSAGKSLSEPLYELTLSGDGFNAYVSVSQKGGKIVNLSVSRAPGKEMLSEDNAKDCAKKYAARLGYEVEPVWYLKSGGVAYVNLAPIENDVVIYTDLVKVKVALDNGEALGLEAKNFCLNHTSRDTTLKMNPAAVPTLIDERLTLNNVRGAYIPLENGAARLCYEAACEYDGIDYFVYLDAYNGETVKIMRTVNSEQGKLVM